MSEIYLKSVVRRWKRDLAEARSEILVFSPYLTSDTAELVLRAGRADHCDIYTLFSAEHFATGGSSIRTLQLLLDEGFTIYELPGLHAKIVLVSGVSISVGSQNLTRGGTANREATVLIRDSKEVAKAERELAPWLAERKRITPEMVLDIQASLPALVRKFRGFKKETAAVDEAVQVGLKRRRDERLRNLRSELAALPRANEEVIARVCQIEQISWRYFTKEIYTLLAKPKDDLTRWIVTGRVVRLERMARYICLVEDTGKIGWARVGKTRITFVADGIEGLKLSLADWVCGLELLALWEGGNSEENLKIVLSPNGSGDRLEITAWFGIDDLAISQIKPSRRSAELRRLAQWIKSNRREFAGRVIERLLSPFQYTRNLFGSEATTFFGDIGSRFRLRVVTVGDKPMIQAKNMKA